jgi:predicted nuclease of predicted toxin-antitoxin system
VPIRFHLDEHIPASIAAGLRRRGIDASTSAESGLLAADDPAQLAFAASSGRVLVTHDADFLRLHADGATHAGIA